MRKYTIFTLIFLGMVSCSSHQNGYLKNSIPNKNTYVKDNRPSIDELETIEGVEITEYRDAQQISSNQTPNLTYKNDFGGDFGYFDTNGYYYNGCYFRYTDRYRYQDRLNQRGYFDPKVKHIRVCGEDYDNGNGYYYVAPDSSTIKHRVAHPEHLEERFLGSGSYLELSY